MLWLSRSCGIGHEVRLSGLNPLGNEINSHASHK